MTCKNIQKQSATLRGNERGLSTVEYALLFVLIVGGSAALWSQLGGSLKTGLTSATTSYSSAMSP